MLVMEKNSDVTICDPEKDVGVCAAKDIVLQAVAAAEEAKDRLARLQRIHRESRDPVERADAKLDLAEAERDVLVLGRDVEVFRRDEAELRQLALKRLQAHYRPKFRESLNKLDKVFSGPVWEANEAARLIWNEANAAGVKMPTCFCPYFVPDSPRMTSWYSHWHKTLRNEGWLDD